MLCKFKAQLVLLALLTGKDSLPASFDPDALMI